ncbi:cation transporter P-type ATPase ctpJ [Mycobacterium tuberculosis]|nr:cation transporter P-type ATPase ctpJ [Mycobacterium tuberculosis]
MLAKSAIVMEQLGTTTRIAFDKTGTLTRGTPELAGIWVYERRFTDDELLRLAAAAEYPSEHPLGAAIVKAAQSRRIRLPTVGEFTAHPGCRVTARVDGHVIAVGSATALLGTAGAAALEASMITAVDFLQGEGYTVVVVVCDSHPVGLLAITDQLRPEAAAAISAATKLTGAKPVLLTGDNRATADRLGVQVGIDDVRAGLLPDDKVAAVRQLQAGGARLTVVGDGINDAPALAAAHVGIAMGSARSELTLQTADAVVVRDDLTPIPTVIAMSRRARRIVVANLIVAVTFIAGLVVWDLAFTLPLPLGVARHEGSTIIVGLNGLRLLRHTAWRRAAGTAHR